MMLGDLISKRQAVLHLSTEELASDLQVEVAFVEKWIKNQAIPTKMELEKLCTTLDVSCDELIDQLKLPYTVGHFFSGVSLLFFLLVAGFISASFMQFDFTHLWFVWLVLMLLLSIFGLAALIRNYWVIEAKQIVVHEFSYTPLVVQYQRLTNTEKKIIIPYEEIDTACLSYTKRRRFSAFDIWFSDPIDLVITTKNNQTYSLSILSKPRDFLPQLLVLLSSYGVKLEDPQNLLYLMFSGASLYEEIHKEK
ncbi:helix-turn-helix domain-containing protein [Enterococcus alishanensis]